MELTWGNIISWLLGGGALLLITLREKKGQEKEKTAQEHEHTRQEKIDTLRNEFVYLKERTEFAEKHITELHTKMQWMQGKMENLAERTIFAETHICLNTPCKKRRPALGTYDCKKKAKEEMNDGGEELHS